MDEFDRRRAPQPDDSDETKVGSGEEKQSESEEGGDLLQPRPAPLDEQGKEPAKNKNFPGAEFLSGGSSREVLRRLHEGDPLDLDDRCFERLRHRAILLDNRRLYVRAIARIATQALRYDGIPSLAVWLDECIDWSIRSLIDDDAEEERCGNPPTEPWDPNYAFISETLGIEPPLARKVGLVFNGLPSVTRRTFWAIVMQGKSIHRWIAEGHGPPERVQARLTYALGMMSSLGKLDMPCPDEPDKGVLGDE